MSLSNHRGFYSRPDVYRTSDLSFIHWRDDSLIGARKVYRAAVESAVAATVSMSAVSFVRALKRTESLPSRHRCCQNAPTSITDTNDVSKNSVSSSQSPYQHISSFPDSQQLTLSQPLPQLPPTSLPTNAESPIPSTPSSPIHLHHL